MPRCANLVRLSKAYRFRLIPLIKACGSQPPGSRFALWPESPSLLFLLNSLTKNFQSGSLDSQIPISQLAQAHPTYLITFTPLLKPFLATRSRFPKLAQNLQAYSFRLISLLASFTLRILATSSSFLNLARLILPVI